MITSMENLLNLMNLRITGIVAVCRTSDGHYLGQDPDDVGYNRFFGKPSQLEGAGLQRSREVWKSFSDEEKVSIRAIAESPPDGSPIPLSDFGVLDN